MTTEYEYQHTDFPNATFNEDSLNGEVLAKAEITTTLEYIRSVEDHVAQTSTAYFGFQTVLSSEEQAALDAVVAAHQGLPPMKVVWHASSVLAEIERSVTAVTPAWSEIGGSVTTPDFFTPDVQNCKGRVVGQYKTNGAGARIRLREGDVEPSASVELPDSGGEWAIMQWFSVDSVTAGTHKYTLEGQLPESGATEMAVKYVAVSLLEFTR